MEAPTSLRTVNSEQYMPLTAEQIRAIERMEIVDPAMVAVMQKMTPAEKYSAVNAMWCSAHDMIRNLLEAEHPEWSQEQMNQEMARRMLHDSR
jgi:hypothetical protein